MRKRMVLGGLAVVGGIAAAATYSATEEADPAGPGSAVRTVTAPSSTPDAKTPQAGATSSDATAASPSAFVPAAPAGSGFVLAYADEFDDDAVGRSDWYYRITGKYTAGYNRQENVTESGGTLKIRYGYEDVNNDGTPDFTGGGVISRHLFGYGYYETRAKLWAGSPGLHTSFWTMGVRVGSPGIGNDPLLVQDIDNSVFPENNQLFEIDGFEHDSPNILETGTVAQSSNADTTREGKKSGTTRGVNYGDWNVYGFDFQPGYIRFYINGTLVYSINNTSRRYQFTPSNLWLTALPYSSNSNPGALPGVSEFDYVRYYANAASGVNRLGNPSFDARKAGIPLWIPGGWIENYDKPASRIVEDDIYDGTRALQHTGTSAYQVTTKQDLTYLPNGTYTLSAWVKSSGGQSSAKMRVLGYGGAERTFSIPATATWTQITIPNVAVTSGKATVAFSSNASGGQWLLVDKVFFGEN